MTKQTYFDICVELNQEPIDEEIPLDVEDFPDIIQHILFIYGMLEDIWDTMNGQYLGKNYNIVFNILSLYVDIDTEEYLFCLEILQHIDGVRSKIINSKKTPPTKKPLN